jgi:ribosomal protein S18
MFNEERENILIERLVRRQEKANEQILKELGKLLGEIGQLTPSEAYTIGQQLKYGESLQKIIKILSQTSQLTEVEIYQMLEGEARHNLAFSKKYFKAQNVDFIPYKDNKPLQMLVNEVAVATINNVGVSELQNISRTTGITYLDRNGNRVTKNIIDAYNEIVDDAIVNVATGKESFQQELQRQLKTIGQSGIQKIEYESGRHRRIDSAMRMNLKDGLSQLAIAQQEIVGGQFGNDGWEVTVHSYPAIDHEDIQGHIFYNEEFDKLQDYEYFGDIKDVNGIIYTRTESEHIRPIGELNCYHVAMAIVVGIDKPRYTQEGLDKINQENEKGFDFEDKHYTLYEGTQLQRQLELAIRRNRETEIMAKASGESGKQLLEDTRYTINQLFDKYHALSQVSGLPTKLERTRLLTK